MRAARHVGFTLVEVLVGMTVAALALTAGFTALAFVEERARHAEAATVASLSGATTRGLLVDWLAGARLRAPNRGETFQGLDAEEHGVPSDELIFPTTGRTQLQAPVTVVRLYVDHDDETPERGLVAELAERQGDDPRRVELLPQVSEMELRYLPDLDGPAAWLPSWIARNELPRAIEVVLRANGSDTLPSLLRYPLRVPLGTLR